MISKTKVIFTLLLALFAFGAVASTALATPEPYFANKSGTLTGGKSVTGKAVIGAGTLTVPALNLVLKCKTGSGKGEVLNREESNKTTKGVFLVGGLAKTETVFEECEVEGAAVCEVNGKVAGKGVVTATGISGKVGYVKGTTKRVLFHLSSANAEGVFTTVKLGPEECSVAGTYPVKKGVIGEFPEKELNTLKTGVKLELKKNAAKEQEWKELENPNMDLVENKEELLYGGHPAAIETSATLTGSEEVGLFT
jgi:hypothetical protein